MHSPCLLFLDEIDAITGKRDSAGKDMERRIVAQLLTCMDSLSTAARVGLIETVFLTFKILIDILNRNKKRPLLLLEPLIGPMHWIVL